MMNRRSAFLTEIVDLLVAEWGYKEVQRAVIVSGAKANRPLLSDRPQGDAASKHEARRSRKPMAVEYVRRLGELSDAESLALSEIAARFDRREFLPTMGDVREFLAMQGQTPTDMKDRAEAFRRVLPVLQQLPTEKLEGILRSASYSGPAKLGPLSDAIRATGESLRRSEDPSDS